MLASTSTPPRGETVRPASRASPEDAFVRHNPFNAGTAFQGQDLLPAVQGQALFGEMLTGHAGQHRAYVAGQDMIHDFNNGDLQAPHVRQGFGHLQADETRTNHDRPGGFARAEHPPDGFRVAQVGHCVHSGQGLSGDVQPARGGSGGQDQLVVGNLGRDARIKIAGEQTLARAADFQGFGAGQQRDVLAVAEEGLVPYKLEACGPQLFQVGYVSGNEVGDAAAAVGNHGVPVDQCHPGGGRKAFEAAGGFGTQRHRADDDHMLVHA